MIKKIKNKKSYYHKNTYFLQFTENNSHKIFKNFIILVIDKRSSWNYVP